MKMEKPKMAKPPRSLSIYLFIYLVFYLVSCLLNVRFVTWVDKICYQLVPCWSCTREKRLFIWISSVARSISIASSLPISFSIIIVNLLYLLKFLSL